MTQIRKEKSVRVSDLAEQFDVTEETIRRDLDKLDKEGKVKKTYGGAILEPPVSEDPSFMDRQKVNMASKQAIGKKASELIEDGETVFIDMSTTALEVIKAVEVSKQITVITNSLEALVALSNRNNIHLISIGGSLDKNNLFMGGPMALKFIDHYYADKTFFSVKGLTTKRGFMDTNEYIAEIKAMMVKNTKEAILVVDESKFYKSALISSIELSNVTKVITDFDCGSDWVDYFSKHHIEIINS